jgi:hypothetical protein
MSVIPGRRQAAAGLVAGRDDRQGTAYHPVVVIVVS